MFMLLTKIKAMLPLAVLLLVVTTLHAAGDNEKQSDKANDEIIVNNVWVDVPFTQVIRDISIETAAVIAISPKVSDMLVSLDAGQGKNLDECLEQLVAGKGIFVHKRSKRFYVISSGDPSCPGFIESAESKRVYLKYITAKHVTSVLPTPVRKYVSFGARSNEILLYAPHAIVTRIENIIKKLDVPQPQIILEVLVVELWQEATEQFGLDWEYSDGHTAFNLAEGLGLFSGLARYTSVPKANLTSLSFTLRALIGNEQAEVRSRPRVATLNGQKASIDITLEEYFTIATDLYASSSSLRTELEVIKSGVLLEMTPYIGNNNDITVDVLTEVSDVASRQNHVNGAGTSAGNLPIIRRRKARTCVRVKDGDAIVIGGLIESQKRKDDKRVPLLSSIPFLGGAFKSNKDVTINKEVVIFITPRIMRSGSTDAFAARHKLINIAQEIDKLKSIVSKLDGKPIPPLTEQLQGVSGQKYLTKADVEKEIQILANVTTTLTGVK